MTNQIMSDLILPILVNLVSPKIDAVLKKYKLFKEIDREEIQDNFEKYLKQRYEKFLVIDTLVFSDRQTLFDTLYQPLTLSIKPGIYTVEEELILIDKYPKELLPRYCRIIIEDTAGMGKSTITRKIFKSIVEEGVGIPVLIDLRHLKTSNTILNELESQFSPLGRKFDFDLILKVIEEGGFIFLFDGYDEIALSNREFVYKDLHTFIEKANNNYFLITSRPEDSLASFGDFQKAHVNPLKREEAYALIKRYDLYSYKSCSEELIKQLEENKDASISEYLENPFLVSLLYISFRYQKYIPLKKSQFYSQVYDALFEKHDLSKDGFTTRDKHSGLYKDDFERVLRYIGFFTAIDNEVDYNKDSLTLVIERVKAHLPNLIFKSSDFLLDLLQTVPLFKKDGNNIRWSHKSLQDYFAAKFIWIDARENQEPILNKIYKDISNSRFYNMLDIFYELDPQAFEKHFAFWLLSDFKETYDNLNTIFKDHIDNKAIIERAERSFIFKSIIYIPWRDHYKDRLADDSFERSLFEVHDQMAEMGYNLKDSTLFFTLTPPRVIFSYRYKSSESSKEIIMDLLINRRPELSHFVIDENNSENIVQPLESVTEELVHFIDDEFDNILNSPENFEKVNCLIGFEKHMNFKESMAFLEQLKNQRIKTSTNEFLNW